MGYKVVQYTRRLEVSRQHHTTLAAFAEYADNDTGEGGVGIATVAANTGYNEKTIRRHRTQLVEMGILAVRRGRLPRMKRVADLVSFPGYQADILGISGGQNVQVSGGHSDPDLADISSRSGGHSEHPLHIEGEVEEKEQREEAPACAGKGGAFTEEEIEEAWRVAYSIDSGQMTERQCAICKATSIEPTEEQRTQWEREDQERDGWMETPEADQFDREAAQLEAQLAKIEKAQNAFATAWLTERGLSWD